jgi:hypothetical protein
MLKSIRLTWALFVFGATAATSLCAASPAPVTMTVTAVAKKNAVPPPIKKDDVQLYIGKERRQVTDWKPGDKLYLAVLIDDSLDSSVSLQWQDLGAFFNQQPENTYISVSYARNGTAMLAQNFTNDHALAAKALRIPLGGAGAFSSPYLALLDLIKRWTSSPGDRRSVLMVSSGIDYFRGDFPRSPDVDNAIQNAQKSNINIWTIYAPDDSHLGRAFFRLWNAQAHLSQLSQDTGGESYYTGVEAPVSFKPYLDEIALHLKNQYLLTFAASGGGKKGRFVSAHVTTEIANVQFLSPSQVFLPAGP